MKALIWTISIQWFLSIINLMGQDYLITFAGSGASSTVTSVTIENLTQLTTLTMSGNDVLHLQTVITNIEPINRNRKIHISLFPNPMTDYSILQFYLPENGKTVIGLYDIYGRKITETQTLLTKGQHTYRLEGIESGIYFVTIISNNYSCNGKLMSTNPFKSEVEILYENSLLMEDTERSSVLTEKENSSKKGLGTESVMQYTFGDRLRFTANSGNYSTIITDIPSSSKTITFNFFNCTDGDNTYYPVIVIGTQTWMAKNLNTTKYNDGTAIPSVTADNAQWAALTTDAYCEYENLHSNSLVYGRLYNWYVIDNNVITKQTSNGGKNVCPIGWHVPSSMEWTTLITYLGGESTAGSKLRETGSSHWLPPNNVLATNETGFTALPGGNRNTDGVFVNLRYLGFWWSSTESSATNAYIRCTQGIDNAIPLHSIQKNQGLSVRCIRD